MSKLFYALGVEHTTLDQGDSECDFCIGADCGECPVFPEMTKMLSAEGGVEC